MKQYSSLFSKHRDQSPEEVFSFFPFNGKNGENWEAPYEKLASNLARHEDWNFTRPEFKKRYKQKLPILTNYLNYTFIRLQELERISFSKDGSKACFNTGLQTQDEKDIYATFFRNINATENSRADWTFYTFVDSYSHKLDCFKPLPELATFITDASDLVFDTTLEIEVNFEHIIDQNSDRLPLELQSNRRLALTAIKGAVESLKSKIIRNYKVAIPHWYDGRMQLLLPLNLTSDTIADVALVVDRDRQRNMYRARTVLSMDMAYIDARLITRPDREWLNP